MSDKFVNDQISKEPAPSPVARAKVVTGLAVKALENQVQIVRSADALTTWLLAIAVGGIGLSVTQSKTIIETSLLVDLLPIWSSKLMLVAATLLFSVSVFLGLSDKVRQHTLIGGCYQKTDFLGVQLACIEFGEVPLDPLKTTYALYGSLFEGHYLPDEVKEKFKQLNAGIEKTENSKVWAGQLRTAYTGIALLAIVALL
jgi:hypothetical protein